MDFTRNEKEWRVMKQWVENNYNCSIKRLAKDNDLNYNRLLKINKKLYKVNDIMAFINSKIEKYSLNEVVEEVVEEVADDSIEKVVEEPIIYVLEKSLGERVAGLDNQVSYLTQKVYNLQAKNDSIYRINNILFLISLYSVGLDLYNLFSHTF